MNKRKEIHYNSIFIFSLLTTAFFCLALLLVTKYLRVAVEEGYDHHVLFNIQNTIIIILLVILGVIGALSYFLVAKPLDKMTRELHDHKKLTLTGAQELCDLGRTYNRMYTQLTEESNKLSFEASHDQLTGLYNRKVFDEVRADANMSAYTLILLDIDQFKNFNDVYGHDLGDKILQKMGKALQTCFRGSDYPCRIGGDEFVVIVVRTDESLKDLIISKIEDIKKQMADTSDGLPKVTISTGVAFSDGTKDVYKEADEALYDSKAQGNDIISFYEKTSIE